MAKIKDIYDFLCRLAPLELQCSFDNSGFQTGRGGKTLKKALLALDVTNWVIDEAVEKKAELIISHHPLIFTPVKCVTDEAAASEKLLRLAEKGIAVISMHTNLDIAQGGVNDVLITALGAVPEAVLDAEGCGRIGTLSQPVSMDEFLVRCKDTLKSKGLRFYSAGRPVQKLAAMGGSGGDCIQRAFTLGCDTYVTADIKYHQFLQAAELGINLIDADHFCTENPITPVLRDQLNKAFPDVDFETSESHGQIIDFI